jgi:two-component system cell cycle response regulator PopA
MNGIQVNSAALWGARLRPALAQAISPESRPAGASLVSPLRLVLRSHDSRRARALSAPLEAAELTVTVLSGPAATRPAPEGEDVTLIDGGDLAAAESFTQMLREANAPALALVVLSEQTPPQAHSFDAWLSPAAPSAALRRRIESVYRDGVMQAEAEARARTAGALGLNAPTPAAKNRPPAALFVGAPGPAYLPLESAFARCGGQMRATFTAFSAFDHLHDDRFDALVLYGSEDASAALSLISALRRNARLYDMPALLFANDADTRQAGLDRGADEAAAPTGDTNATAMWLAEDIRRARQRRALVRALEAPIAEEGQDFLFFGYHVAGLAQSHHDHGRPLSLAILDIDGQAADAEAWTRGFRELRMLASRLVRASDSTAVLNDRALVFAFPNTTRAGAEIALKRVVEVCECTAFAAGDGGQGPLSFATRTGELSPGESGAGLLARVLQRKAA